MLRAELRRILKTRSTWVLAAVALLVCLGSALSTVRQVVKYVDGGGRTEIVRGVSVYEENRERYSPIRGEATPELFARAVELHHELLERYGTDYDIPPEISGSVLGPYSPVYTWIFNAFSDENGAALTSADITPERARGYYEERLATLERTLREKYEQTPQVVGYALERLGEEEGNFYYSYGIGSTGAFANFGLCAFLVTLICIVVAAPVFASDYASGADDVLRCTRHGRARLAAVKAGSALLICSGVFALSLGAFLAVMYLAFGFDDITSAELMQIAFDPWGLDAMGVLGLMVLSAALSLLATVGFTLFLSSRFRSPLGALALAAAAALVPTVIRMFMAGGSFGRGFAAAEGNLLNWLRVCLPTGGVSLTGAMLDELTGLRFLWIGGFVTWSPYVLLIAAAAQIPLWFALSLRAYCRRGRRGLTAGRRPDRLEQGGVGNEKRAQGAARRRFAAWGGLRRVQGLYKGDGGRRPAAGYRGDHPLGGREVREKRQPGAHGACGVADIGALVDLQLAPPCGERHPRYRLTFGPPRP